MSTVVVFTSLTLDGVMQAPGRPDEDTRGGFAQLLEGDAADAVAKLKEQPGKDLTVLGSGQLAGSLIRRGLVDRYVLLIHPLALGPGRRLFPDDAEVALRLVDSVTTTTGVLIATYEPAGR